MTDHPKHTSINPQANEPALDFFDVSVILEQTEGDRELAKELAQIFIESSELLLTEMDGSFARGDVGSIQDLAHNIKGSVGNFGALGAQKAAHELELMARRNDLGSATSEFETLKREIAGMVSELRLYIKGTVS